MKFPMLGAILATLVILLPSTAFADNLASKDISAPVAHDTAGSTVYLKHKLSFGADGTFTDLSVANPMPVVQTGAAPLPSGAATSALQTTGNSTLNSINAGVGNLNSNKATATLQTAGNSALLSIASRLQAKTGGASLYRDYGVTAVTGAYQVLTASATIPSSETIGVYIFDSSGRTLTLAFGAPGAEVDFLDIPPGGQGFIPQNVQQGQAISIIARHGDATSGELIIQLF